MAGIMNPTRSKSDGDIMYDIERWLDEGREMVALGQPDLPPMCKVTRLKQIATQKIRDQIEFQEQRLIGMAPEKVWDEPRDFALNWSRSRMLDQRAPAVPDPNKMDLNNVSPTGPSAWSPAGLNTGGGLPPWSQEQMMATVKGKGKGPTSGKG